jgi:hypothetical protein
MRTKELIQRLLIKAAVSFTVGFLASYITGVIILCVFFGPVAVFKVIFGF